MSYLALAGVIAGYFIGKQSDKTGNRLVFLLPTIGMLAVITISFIYEKNLSGFLLSWPEQWF